MKTFLVCCVFALVYAANAKLECKSKLADDITTDWIDMVSPCTQSVRGQIQEELKASLQYLSMAAHFSRDTVNRPGFAKMFFESASEERQHAIKLIDYLLMRGDLTKSVSKLIETTLSLHVPKVEWASGVQALNDSLALEAKVTKKIRDVIKVCEDGDDQSKFNDYHLVDYLTGDFLEEQYHGQRELAGKLSTLEKLMEKHGPLGEFLFDKKLLE